MGYLETYDEIIKNKLEENYLGCIRLYCNFKSQKKMVMNLIS